MNGSYLRYTRPKYVTLPRFGQICELLKSFKRNHNELSKKKVPNRPVFFFLSFYFEGITLLHLDTWTQNA